MFDVEHRTYGSNKTRLHKQSSLIASEQATYMWRHDWRKGESVDDHERRLSISNAAGVSMTEAELIWNCAVSEYRGECVREQYEE